MPNPLKGEVAVETASGANYTLVFTIDALSTIEERFDKDINTIFGGAMRMTTLSLAFWAALQHRHPEVDEAGAKAIMDELGIGVANEVVTKAFLAAFDTAPTDKKPAKPAKGATDAASPPEAAAP